MTSQPRDSAYLVQASICRAIETLSSFLTLVYDGLVTQLATGMPVHHLDGVLDLAEQAVRGAPGHVRDTSSNDARSLSR